LAGVAQIGVDVVGDAFRAAREQGTGVREDQRVVVDVDDARFRGDRLGHLMGVVRGRQTGADVEELADAGFAGEIPDGTGEEAAGEARVLHNLGEGDTDLVADGPVGREVVFAAQPVVPDPSRLRHAAVEPGRLLWTARSGRTLSHGAAPFRLRAAQRID